MVSQNSIHNFHCEKKLPEILSHVCNFQKKPAQRQQSTNSRKSAESGRPALPERAAPEL
jgi:hypothetical protein